jgi:chemotaxis protein MotB
MTLGLLAAGLGLGGCNDSLKQENALLTEENQALRDELNSRNAALETANLELRDRSLEVSRLRRELDTAGTAAGTPFDNIPGVTGAYGAGTVTATVENDILFDSGKATLKNGAKKALDAVASVLNSSYAGQAIRVFGHTDTDPIKKSGHKSNYHLGFERAYAVREYLITKGVDAKRIALGSFGPNEPRESKEKSRRVEIAVMLQ